MSSDNVKKAKNESGKISISIRGIPETTDRNISADAIRLGKSKNSLIVERIEHIYGEMSHPGPLDRLVEAFDTTLAEYLAIPLQYGDDLLIRSTPALCRLLQVDNTIRQRELLLSNGPYQFRHADQLFLNKPAVIPYGLSLNIALFTELAARDKPTIEAAWETIFRPLWLPVDAFYDQINTIRRIRRLDQVFPGPQNTLPGPGYSVTVYQPPGYQTDVWRARITLAPERLDFAGVLRLPRLTFCHFLPERHYVRIVPAEEGKEEVGFHFLDGVSDFQVYASRLPGEKGRVCQQDAAQALADTLASAFTPTEGEDAE